MTLRDQGKQPEQRYRVTEAEAWCGRCHEASPEGRAQALGSSKFPGEPPPLKEATVALEGEGEEGEGRKVKGGGRGTKAGLLEAWDPLEHTLETTWAVGMDSGGQGLVLFTACSQLPLPRQLVVE